MVYPDPKENWQEARKWAEYFCDVFMDFSWIKRRVETITIIDTYSLKHKISIDIDTSDIRKLLRHAGLSSCQQVPVPLDTITKGLLLDLDIRDSSGHAVSLGTSESAAEAARLAVLGLACRKGLDEHLSDSIKDWIGEAVGSLDVHDKLPECAQSDISGLVALLGDAEIHDLIFRFRSNYPLFVTIDCSSICTLLKYSFLDSTAPPSRKQRLPLLYKHTKLVLDNLRIGEARSEHLHIVAPDGVEFVKDPHLIENETKRPVQELKKTSRYRSKTTPEQVSIYTNTTLTDSDRFDVALAMQPAVKGLILNLLFAFPLSALIPLVLLAGLLFSSPCIETAFLSSGFRGLASYAVEYAGDLVGLEGLLGVFTHTVSLEDQTMPYLTLMNFVPVVVLGIVLKNEDHFMRRNMLHWARRAIQTSIGVSLLATTFLAAGLVLFVPLMAVAVIFNIVFWAATIAQFYVFQSRRKYIRRSAATTKLLKPVMVRRERQQA